MPDIPLKTLEGLDVTGRPHGSTTSRRIQLSSFAASWMSVGDCPSVSGWYYTKDANGLKTSRYYDSGSDSWWVYSATNNEMTSDENFRCWLTVPGVSNKQG